MNNELIFELAGCVIFNVLVYYGLLSLYCISGDEEMK